jgi:heme/copper-type cytochrome/quinol oxidase subunit 3
MEQPERRRPNALEVRNTHGIAAIGLLVWVIWCIRDGWFNPGYEHITFSRSMAYISTPILIFCSIMAGSAMMTLRRQQQPPPPQEPPDSPPPA